MQPWLTPRAVTGGFGILCVHADLPVAQAASAASLSAK